MSCCLFDLEDSIIAKSVVCLVSRKSLDDGGFGFFVSKIFRACVTLARLARIAKLTYSHFLHPRWICASSFFGHSIRLHDTVLFRRLPFGLSYLIHHHNLVENPRLGEYFLNILVATNKALTTTTSAPNGQPQTCPIRHIVVVCTHMKSLTS